MDLKHITTKHFFYQLTLLTPIQEEEKSFSSVFLHFVFLHSHDQESSASIMYTALSFNAPVTPCGLESPLNLTYTELVKALTYCVDPQPSTWDLQDIFFCQACHNFQEPVKILLTKKLTTGCDLRGEH